MRWFVVCASAPEANGPSGTAQAHPPGPGFPLQAPSVYTTVATAKAWHTPPPVPLRQPGGDPRDDRVAATMAAVGPWNVTACSPTTDR